MDLVAGKPVFLEEIVAQGADFLGQSVRVTGTLHSYSPATESAVLVEGQSALVIDTRLLGVVKYHVGQTYQFIGVLNPPAVVSADTNIDDVRCATDVQLHARVSRVVDGLDMVVYRRAIMELRTADIL
ncbi:hypothetical protein H4R99_003975 [Coemansia sp. RSA 1722]|nr:hypothetical protein IWW45_008210 [Coemansia sp. RSA 485]KAJ2598748.1 hypothetical protein H4R99_003975 [Coemansia sp. RSA 1722]KAJ2636838.1 hypothetical protein GGF40_002757 [Coemansia sp. RSA 1286]